MSAEDRFTKHKLLINSRNEAKKKPDFRSANAIKEEDSCLFLFISCAVSVLFALAEFLIVSVEECHDVLS
jgi:hypothetical protein